MFVGSICCVIVLKDMHASHELLPAQLRGSAVSAPALQALAEPFVASLFAPTVFLPVQHSMNMCFSKTLLYCPLSDSFEDQLIFQNVLTTAPVHCQVTTTAYCMPFWDGLRHCVSQLLPRYHRTIEQAQAAILPQSLLQKHHGSQLFSSGSTYELADIP